MNATRKALQDRRAVMGVLTAAMTPVLLGITALVVDTGVWTVSKTRLQLAVDAAAVSSSYLLANATVKAMNDTSAKAEFARVALAGVDDFTARKMIGTLTTPVGIEFGAGRSSVTVTLTSQGVTYFAGAVGLAGPTITASATVSFTMPPTCVLTLNNTTTQKVMRVDSNSQIVATNCAVYSNSGTSQAIDSTSGFISGSTVGAHGGILRKTSGAPSVSPNPPREYGGIVEDPFASRTFPAHGACQFNSFKRDNGGTYTVSPGVYCGDTMFGGSSTTIRFTAGVYYIVNGNLKIDQPTITAADGITFVITGATPGEIDWKNKQLSGISLKAPTSGPFAGLVFLHGCPASSGASPKALKFFGGQALVLNGSIYAPCGIVNLETSAEIQAAPGGSLSVVADQIFLAGSSKITAASQGRSVGTTGGSLALLP